MTNQLSDPFIIKIEPDDEDQFNQFQLGLNEPDNESSKDSLTTNQQEQRNICDSDYELIAYLKLKLKETKSKLKNVVYKYKVKHALELLLRKQQSKTIKSLREENLKLKQKATRFDQLSLSLKKLCINFIDSNQNESDAISTRTDNQISNQTQIEHDPTGNKLKRALARRMNKKFKQRLARKPCNQKTFNQAQTQTIEIVSLVNPYENQLRSTDFENTLPQHSINPNETFNFETNFNFTQINPTSSEISNLTFMDDNRAIIDKEKRSIGKAIDKNLKLIGTLMLAQKPDLNVFKSFTNNGSLKKSEFTQSQASEMNFFFKLFKNHLKSIGIETLMHYVLKNNFGYTFRERCSSNGECKGAWFLKVNVNEDIAQIYYNQECIHSSFC